MEVYMFSIKQFVSLLLLSVMSLPVISADSSELGGRANIMECSYDEVAAYMELPDPKRSVMKEYNAWTKAYKSTELVRSESDPRVCLSVLYGDLSVMANQLKTATQELLAMQPPGMGELLSRLSDSLMESICSRVEAVRDDAAANIINGIDTFRQQAEAKLMRRYGYEAMEDRVLEAVIPPEFEEAGLRYRNGKIDRTRFRNKIKSRWTNELDELRDDVVGTD